MDSLLFRWFVKHNGDTMESLAVAMGIHPQTLYMKQCGTRQQFTQREIAFIADRYELSADDIANIFFADAI